MATAELLVGPFQAADGTKPTLRGGKTGEGIISELHGRYYEQTSRQNVYSFANQAAVTSGAGLSTTVATLALSNNIGSKSFLSILNVSWEFSAAPAAATVIWLVGGFNGSANVTHTTPGIPQNNFLGANIGQGKVDTAATLPTAPVVLLPIVGAAAAAAFPQLQVAALDIGGSILIPPGGYVAFQALTAAVGFAGITWEEVVIF